MATATVYTRTLAAFKALARCDRGSAITEYALAGASLALGMMAGLLILHLAFDAVLAAAETSMANQDAPTLCAGAVVSTPYGGRCQ
jgi:hypothetical protein